MTNINHLLTKLRDAGDRASYKPHLYHEAANVIEKFRKALDFIAEGIDVGRHDGLPEDGPAHDADTMFAVAREALKEKA
jgi:hypothetical protein